MNVPLISIIVPIYRAEKYIKKCVDSILAQTYSNIEVVLVDDGSPDGCPAICDEYARKDDRVKVIHQENGGISKARNNALSMMSGEYVAFVDSDDYVEADYIERLQLAIGDADAVVCSYTMFYENSEQIDRILVDDYELAGNELIKEAFIRKTIGNFKSPWAKLYLKNACFFDEKLSVGEDVVYNIEFLRSAKKIKGINYLGYHLRMHESSTTHKIEVEYTPLYEHDYTYIHDAKISAEKRWNIDSSIIEDEVRIGKSLRFFHEVCNILAKNTPYNSLHEKICAIKKIHNDKDMMGLIKQNKFPNLRPIGKVSYICVLVDNSHFTYIVFLLVTLFRNLKKI